MQLSTPDHAHLVERVTDAAGRRPRAWTIRDDSGHHYHNVVRASESPLVLRLLWRASATEPSQVVGLYRLHLPALIRPGYVRRDPVGGSGDMVRVRFRQRGGLIYLQVRDEQPQFAVGRLV